MRSNCLQGVRGGSPPPKPEQAWMDFEDMRQRNEDDTAVADKEPAKLPPKVIMYDELTGLPQFAQDVRVAPDQHASIATVPWKEWLRGRCANLGR